VRKLQDAARTVRNIAIMFAVLGVLAGLLANPELLLIGLKKAILAPLLGSFEGSHEIMFPAVSLITLQRVFAAAQGIDICKYY
jgi:hypothetical protein